MKVTVLAALSTATSGQNVTTDVAGASCSKYTLLTGLPVFHIMHTSAPAGLTNKNAGTANGEMEFIFGDAAKAPPHGLPRGCERYYDDGVIELAWVSVTGFGPYEYCTHAEGTTTYTCSYKGNAHKPGADGLHPGLEDWGGQSRWMSFPAAGEGKYWKDESPTCPRVRLPAAKTIQAVAKALGCSCDRQSQCDQCASCVQKRSRDDQRKAFNQMFGIVQHIQDQDVVV